MDKSNVIDKLKNGGVNVVRTQVEYKVSDTTNKNFVKAIIHNDGKISIRPAQGENFIFKKSDKDLVYKIARLIMEATKIEDK